MPADDAVNLNSRAVTAINWVCPACKSAKSTRTTVDEGTNRFHVPKCRNCHMRNNKDIRCAEGILVYDNTPEAEASAKLTEAEPDIRRGVFAQEVVKGEVFKQLCTVLDAFRVMSGGGTPIPGTCIKCSDTCAHGCSCVCHPAWQLRGEVEKKAAA